MCELCLSFRLKHQYENIIAVHVFWSYVLF